MSPKQQRFIEEYLIDLNAAGAARRAGYSERTAKQQGARLLTNVDVQAAIQQTMAVRAEHIAVDADYVLRRLKEEAEWRGDGATHSGRVRALELLGKHLKLYTEVTEQQTTTKIVVVEDENWYSNDGHERARAVPGPPPEARGADG